MSNEKNNAADNKKLVIGPIDFIETSKKEKLTLVLVFAGFLIFIGVIFLVTYSTISSYPMWDLLAIMAIGFGLFLAIPYSIILLKYPKYATFVFLMVAGGFLIVIGVSLFFTVQRLLKSSPAFRWWFSIFRPQILSIVGGFILLIASSIKFSVKNVRQKKLDSMSQSDLVNMFTCPECGSIVATYLIKLEKDQILVKQNCPIHLVKVYRIPLRLKDQCISYFRDTVFRCYKCGQEATVDHLKFSKPWTLIKLSCTTQGNKIPTHKIWSTVYSNISNGVDAKP